MKPTITVTLSSANMGDVSEHDFDLWTRYVTETIDAATGLDVSVEQGRFGDGGEDVIVAQSDADRETVRAWLSVDGWEAFCAGPWQAMADAS